MSQALTLNPECPTRPAYVVRGAGADRRRQRHWLGGRSVRARLPRALLPMFVVPMMLDPSLASAEQRYQAIPVGPGYEFGAEKVMILDTESGHIWLWLESPATSKDSGGRYLIYQGQARPGREVGEVIGKQQWPPGQ